MLVCGIHLSSHLGSNFFSGLPNHLGILLRLKFAMQNPVVQEYRIVFGDMHHTILVAVTLNIGTDFQ